MPAIIKTCFIALCLYGCVTEAAARGLPDSVSLRYLSAIASARTDTGRILRMLNYSKALMHAAPDSSLAIDRTALKQSRDIGFEEGIILSLIQAALVKQEQGLFEEAWSNLSEALALCKGDNVRYRPDIYSYMGANHFFQGNYPEAADYYYKSILITEKHQRRLIRLSWTYLNLSVVWIKLQDEEKSLYYLDKAMAAAIEEKDSVILGDALNKKGNIYSARKEKDKAFDFFTRAYKISHACKDLVTEAGSCGNLSDIYRVRGMRKQAREYLERCWQLSQNPKLNVYHRLNLLFDYGGALVSMKEYTKAEECLLLAIQQADSLHAPLYKVVPLSHLSDLYFETGDYDKAYRYKQAYASLSDSLVNEEKVKAANLLEKKYRLAQKDKILSLKQLEVTRQEASLARKNMLIATVAMGGGLLLLLFFTLRRNYKRKLKLDEENVQALSKAQELERLRAMMKGEEAERKRVAMELHDDVGSMLSIAKLNLSIVRDRYNNQEHFSDFNEVMQLLDRSSKSVRDTAHSLVPEILLREGIEDALRIHSEKTAVAKSIKIDFHTYGAVPEMSREQEQMLFRVLQELLREAIEYTGADNILFQLNWQESLLYVTLEANGYMRHDAERSVSQSSSLDILKKRIESINGLVDITSNGVDNITFDLEFRLEDRNSIPLT